MRVAPAVLFVISVSVLALAASLEANESGVGTHRQLGFPACGFLSSTGLPCATCGMTTAFTHAVHGRPLKAFLTQPVGAVLAVLTAVLALVSGYATIAGASLAPLGRSLARPAIFWTGGALLLAAWVFKILVFRGVI
ncbi:MAG: DUF2752 domain-containing protein [Phycisphaeraceae bacterium]